MSQVTTSPDTISPTERLIERLLWFSRLLAIIPVFFSVLLALAMFVIASIDSLLIIGNVFTYIGSPAERGSLQSTILAAVVGALDSYLIAAIMLLFAFGIYELFIGKLDVAEKSEVGRRLLYIKTFDELKDKLAGVVQVILIVKFFQQALKLSYTSATDLLLLGVGIALIGASLYFTRKPPKSADDEAK